MKIKIVCSACLTMAILLLASTTFAQENRERDALVESYRVQSEFDRRAEQDQWLRNKQLVERQRLPDSRFNGNYAFSPNQRDAKLMKINNEMSRKISDLVSKIKKSDVDEEKNTLKEELNVVLNDQYDAYLDHHEEPLKQLEARLEKLRKDFDARKSAKAELVKLRLDTIWYDAIGLGWPGNNAGNNGNWNYSARPNVARQSPVQRTLSRRQFVPEPNAPSQFQRTQPPRFPDQPLPFVPTQTQPPVRGNTGATISSDELSKAKFEKATHWNADPNANIFPDGMLDRHDENNIPIGWQDKSAFETSHARIVEPKRGVVQMECPKDGSETTFGTTLDLPKGTQYVTILTRMRGPSIQLGHSENTGAGMIYSLIGEKGKKRSTPRLEPIYKYGSLGGWKTYRRTIKVRPGETKLGITASMVDVTGHFEVDRVQVVPSKPGYEATPDEVKTMRTAIHEDDDHAIGLIMDSTPELLEYRDGTFENSTPLIYATVRNSPKVVKKLIELGANMEAVDESWKNTPLAWCCWWGNYEAAEVLVKAAAKLKHFDDMALNSKKKNKRPRGQLEDFDRIAQLIKEAKEKAKSSK